MRPWITVLVLAAALVFRPGLATADIITIEPDDFAPGTDVTHVSPGVTLWTITPQDPLTVLLTPTYVRQNPDCFTEHCDAVTGSQGFASHPGASGGLYGEYRFTSEVSRCVLEPSLPSCGFEGIFGNSAMWMEFETGADFVEVSGAWTSDPVFIRAFDANFQTVDAPAGPDVVIPRPPGGGYTKGFTHVTAPEGNIKYVIAGSFGFGSLDTIRYNAVSAVPEPSTLLLCGVGLVGLLRSRRRSRG